MDAQAGAGQEPQEICLVTSIAHILTPSADTCYTSGVVRARVSISVCHMRHIFVQRGQRNSKTSGELGEVNIMID